MRILSESQKGTGLLLLVLAISLVAVGMHSSTALAAEPGDYRGTYRIADLGEAKAERDKAVEEVVAKSPRLFRRYVRKRLMLASTLMQYFEFAPSSGQMVISSDLSSGWATDLAATEIEFKAERGKPFYLSRGMEEGVLSTRGRRKNGQRLTRFELSEDGSRLVVITTISNKRLPAPVVYRTGYVKDPDSVKSGP